MSSLKTDQFQFTNPIDKQYRSLPKRRECPICFITLLSSVFQCYNGHLICEPCLSKIKSCPICREDYPERRIRAREFEEIMRECVVECRYFEFGCKSLLHYEDVLEHESTCPFNRSRCPGVDRPCDKFIEKGRLEQHLEDHHQMTGQHDYKLNDQVWIYHDSLPETSKYSIKISPHFLMTKDQTFFIRACVTQDGQFVQWAVTGNGNTFEFSPYKAVIKLNFFPVSEKSHFYMEWSGPIAANKEFQFGELSRDFLWVPVSQLNACGNQWTLIVKLVNEVGKVVDDLIPINPPKVLQSKVDCIPKVFGNSKLFTSIAVAGMKTSSDGNERTPKSAHLSCRCDGCQANPIFGLRYKCRTCPNFDLCDSCFNKGIHKEHSFYKILNSDVHAPQARSIVGSSIHHWKLVD